MEFDVIVANKELNDLY